ncbi:Hsp70 family protein [Desulfonema magnum]|uniref:Chaperone Hsp70 family protein n=1 Tax=Desulfonema magnum TaxID=45655 RepID=A0A975BJN2_9BACT|nr:Hsp70 family protein [Desulfonema magnum]QTA86553.1 Chaperone Hsp70 family protein [Desulfonema magnum]
MTGTECPKCHQWYLKDSDNYCGYCGHQLIYIELKPDEVTLISQIITQKKTTFINSGGKDTHIRILCKGPSPEFVHFEPANDFTVKANSQTEVNISLNYGVLPSDFTEQDYSFLCIVNNDERKALNLSVKVKTGPKPVLLSEKINFGEITEDAVVQRKLELQNQGAVPLTLKAVKPEGGAHLQVAKHINFPIKIKINDTITIPVIWDSNLYNSAAVSDKTGFHLIFENYKEDIWIPVKGQGVRMELTADRKEIDIDPCLSKQNYTEDIVVTNTGDLDVEISGIETDADWIQIIQEHKTFTLLSSDSAAKYISGPTILGAYKFKALVRPHKLPNKSEGWQEGKIFVYTAGQESVLEIPIRINVVQPTDCQDYIGIDFGTTNSVIAIYDNNDDNTYVVEVTKDKATGKTDRLIPSVLLFEGGHDNYKVGWEAQNEAVISPELAVRSIKRVMGYGNDREFYGKNFSPDELAGCIIKKLIELAETEYYNMTGIYYNITHAIVTVPANFFDLQIRGILKACQIANLDTEEELVREISRDLQQRVGKNVQAGIILDEPSAAALFYLDVFYDEHPELDDKLNSQKEVNFLVFDYGGGTLDVSVVQVEGLSNGSIGIKVLANKGNNMLGGDSIDLALMRQLLEGCKAEISDFDETIISDNFKKLVDRREKEKWSDDVWKFVLSSRYYWKKAAEDIKMSLSTDTETSFDTDRLMLPIFSIENGKVHEIRGKKYSLTVTRYLFEGWIEDILAGCEKLVMDALEFAGTASDSVDYLIHTGRSSLTPAVRSRIRSNFSHLPDENDILEAEHLKVCVARGAAMYGAQKRAIGGSGVHLIAEGRKLPHSYGIAKQVGTRRIFDEIIPLGSTYPAEDIRHYDENQIVGRILHLTFFQNAGKNNKIRGNPDIKRIGEITTNLPDENRTCDVRFVIDANRKLDVFANDEPVDIKPERLEEEDRWIA